MSQHTILASAASAIFDAMIPSIGRLPTSIGDVQPDGSQVLTFTPDLTPAETATLDLLIAAAAASAPVTPAEIQAVRSQLQTGRALRQLGRNAFMALTENERWRMVYDVLVAGVEVQIIDHRETGASQTAGSTAAGKAIPPVTPIPRGPSK